MIRRYRLLPVLLLVSGTAYAQSTPPVVADDTFHTTIDTPLTVETPGVLENDSDADGDSLVVLLVDEPTNGVVTFNRDGSFTYTPDAGFSGTDSFSYRAEEVVLTSFEVDSTLSGVSFRAEVNTQVGSDTDRDSSSVAGTITTHLRTDTVLFDEIHITDMDLRLAEAMSLSFTFSIFGSLDVDTEADSIRLNLLQAGPPVPTRMPFVQPNNQMGIDGTMNVRASGIIGTVIEDGPQPINAIAEGDIGGALTLDGNILYLELPLQFAGTFEVAGNTVDVDVNGLVVASAFVPMAPQTSDVATVTIDVSGVSTATETTAEVPAQFTLAPNYPNPFNPQTTITYTLPQTSMVSLKVYDVLGREVATLVDAQQPAGRREVVFDASALPSGVYVYHLHAGPFQATRTMTVLK